jgi:IS30 family transposase
LEKFIYDGYKAHKSYKEMLIGARSGLDITVDELMRIEKIIYPLIKQHQSIHVIVENHKDEIMLDEKTLYTYIKAGLFDIKPIDLPNMVKMKPRKQKRSVKVETKCRDNRTYRDFLAFMEQNPDTPVVQIDTVIGKKGSFESVLLTIHFVEAELMLAFKRDANTTRSVTDIFNKLYDILGKKTFMDMFQVIVTDNGSEFSNPSAIEIGPDGDQRTRIFYADPSAPYQKGACENNHSLVRRILPKGTSFNSISQNDVNLVMNHVNSYLRKKLKNRTPFEVFSFLHDQIILEKLNIHRLAPDEISLSPTLLKK